MTGLRFVRPSVQYRDAYLAMMADWKENDPGSIPWYLASGDDDFSAMVARLEGFSCGEGLDEGFAANTTFWAVGTGGRMAGAVNIRHRLTPLLESYGGQVGYAVRPSCRRRGYATAMLGMALDFLHSMGQGQALVCCAKDNAGSVKVILKKGGVFESESEVNGEIVQRYRILC